MDVDEGMKMCPECGEEFSESDLAAESAFKNYVVGLVTDSESMGGKKAKGLTKVVVDVGSGGACHYCDQGKIRR